MISQAQWSIYWEGRANSLSQKDAARLAGMSLSSAQARERSHPANAKYGRLAQKARAQPDPVRLDKLGPEAQRALVDFDYFCLRYLGRIPIAWQKEAAEKVVNLLLTRDKEYCVINCPPGAGKSTTFTYAIPLWLTCRDRAIRGLVGSATSKLASQYTANIRRALEATIPLQADDEDKQKGIAVDAEATLSEDFGRFKPVDHESWTKDAFIVQQYDGVSITSKEPTWTAVGRDQEFIGGRYDFCIWDDLVTSNRLRSLEIVEKDRDWWDSYAERRLEPGGLLLLVGQRMGANDLYRYCLNMEVVDIEDDAGDDTEGIAMREGDDGTSRKYHHIIFKGHYEDKCIGATGHRLDADPYPDGCLLSPRRVSWKEVASIQKNKPEMFAQVYQQEDVATSAVLVDPAWVAGCWDRDRERLQIPQGLTGRLISVASVDPSSTQYWGITWWVIHPDSNQFFLIDLEKKKMEAPDLLTWNANTASFSGLMEEWQQTSIDLGVPISQWIVEINAAQRYLLQYEFTQRWQAFRSSEIVSHTTHKNKTDPEYGVQMLGPMFRYGQIRLPGRGAGRGYSMKLVDEVTRYQLSNPKGNTTDLTMSTWFMAHRSQYLMVPQRSGEATSSRPSWLGRRPRVSSSYARAS